MLLVTLYTQLRLTTSKAVNKLESKTCQVAEHNNRCKEGKIIIFLCRVEVLSCETHRYFVVALELKEIKKNSSIIQTNSKQIKITTVGLFLEQINIVFTNDPTCNLHALCTSLHVHSLNLKKKNFVIHLFYRCRETAGSPFGWSAASCSSCNLWSLKNETSAYHA